MAETVGTCRRQLQGIADTEALAQRVAACIRDGAVIWLAGSLGAGKTVFARAFLRARGVEGAVKSPTYTLVEPYRLADGRPAWHLDLYRIGDPGELEWLGLDELGEPSALVLVEWPERGAAALPPADLHLRLERAGAETRVAVLEARSERGEEILACLARPAPAP